jgi:Cu2+-exporting ATPase
VAGHEYTLGRGEDVAGVTVFAVDGRPVARLRLSEHLKADAAAELAGLAARGYQIHLLSGDAPAKVLAAATALGIDPARAEGGLSPEAKADRVRALDRDDTLMVGDGLNDAPSFAAAWCAATPAVDRPVLPGKADFYFLGDGVAALRRALLAGQHLRRVFRANLAFALTYNLAAVAFCLAGQVNPIVAAVIMPATSILVVSWTTYRLTGRRLAWMS